MNPSGHIEKVIDDPDAIRRYHARRAWAKKYGEYRKEDQAAALGEWQPQSPEDLEPIRLNIGDGSVLFPSSNGFADDALYLGEVVRVTVDAVKVLDTSFWRVDVAVIQSEEFGTLTLPIYVSDTLFTADWQPVVGTHVTGNAWLQAYAKAAIG